MDCGFIKALLVTQGRWIQTRAIMEEGDQGDWQWVELDARNLTNGNRTGYSFKNHPLSEAQRIWLKEAAASANFDPRIARVKLLERLPKEFNPDQLDVRLYVNGKVTLIERSYRARDPSKQFVLQSTINGIGNAEVKAPELISLKPTLWGFSIDLKELWRRMRKSRS